LRHYESIFLIKPTLTEEENKLKISKFTDFLTNNSCHIEKCDDMGTRTLAYKVEKHKRGYYYVMYFTTDNFSLIKELERLYKIDEDILKYMTLTFKSNKEVKAWKNLVAGKVDEPKIKQRRPREDTRGGYRAEQNNRSDKYQRAREDNTPKPQTKLESDSNPSETKNKE